MTHHRYSSSGVGQVGESDRYSSTSSHYYVKHGAGPNRLARLRAPDPMMQFQLQYLRRSTNKEDSLSIDAPVFAPLPSEKQYQDLPDKCNLVYIFMIVFGIGSILPFSAITISVDFFNKHVSIRSH